MSIFHHTIYLESSGICLGLVCKLDYMPPEGDGWNEPRSEASCGLMCAMLGKIDIYDSLSKEDVETIEQQAFKEYADDAKEANDEARFEAHQDRINRGDHL